MNAMMGGIGAAGMVSTLGQANAIKPPVEPAAAELINRIERLRSRLQENAQYANICADKICGSTPASNVDKQAGIPTPNGFFDSAHSLIGELERLTDATQAGLNRIHDAF